MTIIKQGAHMINCPKCLSNNHVKSGTIKKQQRYRCKNCNCNYTLNNKGSTKEQRRMAVTLYLEGLGFRSIGRILKFSHVAVYNWIKECGEKISLLQNDKNIEVVEIDEMHSYIGSKKTAVGSGLLLIDMAKDSSTSLLVVGGRKPDKNFGIK